jgi:hypothetical protein
MLARLLIARSIFVLGSPPIPGSILARFLIATRPIFLTMRLAIPSRLIARAMLLTSRLLIPSRPILRSGLQSISRLRPTITGSRSRLGTGVAAVLCFKSFISVRRRLRM